MFWAGAVLAAVLVALLLFRRSRGALLRALSLAALLLALSNPTLRQEERESLANIAKHARAAAANIAVSRLDGVVLVEVADDGVGGADTERGSGLRGLADRVEALGGKLRVWSPPGGGTRLRAEMPCA